MSNQKIRAAAIGSNYCCLPEPKEQSYTFCCFVLYFLHTNKNYLDKGWITSETIGSGIVKRFMIYSCHGE